MTIRRAVVADADRISRLLTEVSREMVIADFSEAGRAYYLRQLAPAQIADAIARVEAFRFYLAEFGTVLAGVAAIRSNSHLYYLFTAADFHRKGIARQLWAQVSGEALVLGNPGLFTVNASLYAVPAYRKFGFAPMDGEQEYCGIRFVPMEYRSVEGEAIGKCENKCDNTSRKMPFPGQ